MAAFAVLLLGMLSLSRLLLVGWQAERVLDADMLGTVFLQGLRFDLVLFGFVLLWPALLLPVACTSETAMRLWRPVANAYFVLCFAAATFMEASTPSFINQFDARPNRIFVEYLVYPREIASTLVAAYGSQLLAASLLVAGSAWLAQRALRESTRAAASVGLITALIATPGLVLASAAMIRSTWDHRAVNPSTVALSDDPMVNDLALNSSYTALYALYERRDEPEGGFRYSGMPRSQVIEAVQHSMDLEPAAFTDPALPTLHRQTASIAQGRPKNLVIILEESLGAEYVGALGGLPLTPNLDALSRQGWWFENLYATGTRSVRGIEALITGFTPTPARSVVKLGGSQRGFFTIAQLLRARGYDTSFIYGGESQFDNMRRFFMNNGFAKSVDENDYKDPVFHGSWGVSDEDLFRYAHEEFSKPRQTPFFSLVFTTSNHSPYEYPDGRIERYDADKNTVNNAVKYADYALGTFIELARQSSYWDDTVFLIVADHNSRVYGAELVPVEHFHIPALVLGGGVEPAVHAPVASQIDLPPTLLSLIGVSSAHPMIGHDLTLGRYATGEGRAIMQYYGTQAYMQGERVIILRQDLPPDQFDYDGTRLSRCLVRDPELERIALAHADWSSIAYEDHLYRLPRRRNRDPAGT